MSQQKGQAHCRVQDAVFVAFSAHSKVQKLLETNLGTLLDFDADSFGHVCIICSEDGLDWQPSHWRSSETNRRGPATTAHLRDFQLAQIYFHVFVDVNVQRYWVDLGRREGNASPIVGKQGLLVVVSLAQLQFNLAPCLASFLGWDLGCHDHIVLVAGFRGQRLDAVDIDVYLDFASFASAVIWPSDDLEVGRHGFTQIEQNGALVAPLPTDANCRIS